MESAVLAGDVERFEYGLAKLFREFVEAVRRIRVGFRTRNGFIPDGVDGFVTRFGGGDEVAGS
jgi:hypothetical protein